MGVTARGSKPAELSSPKESPSTMLSPKITAITAGQQYRLFSCAIDTTSVCRTDDNHLRILRMKRWT
jgi:hypothetical protein